MILLRTWTTCLDGLQSCRQCSRNRWLIGWVYFAIAIDPLQPFEGSSILTQNFRVLARKPVQEIFRARETSFKIPFVDSQLAALQGPNQSRPGIHVFGLEKRQNGVAIISLITAVRLKVEENQLVDVFGEIGFHIDGLKGA